MSAEIQDTATPILDKIAKIAAGRGLSQPLMQAAGEGVETELHKHFDSRDAEGNKNNWPRSHFWLRMVKDVTHFQGATNTEATVSIASRAFLQKLHGGEIRAEGKKLAIPLTAEAKAKGSPREWDERADLFCISVHGNAFLVRKRAGEKKLDFLFVLKDSVHQDPDPKAMPAEGVLEEAINKAATDFVEANIR